MSILRLDKYLNKFYSDFREQTNITFFHGIIYYVIQNKQIKKRSIF